MLSRYFSRRVLQLVLGIIWLLDGLLQLKPAMFTVAFVQQVILPMAQSQPSWVSVPIIDVASWITPHIAAWGVVFAAVQLVLGLALILNILPKTTLLTSFAWSLIVWWFGEGLGQLWTGQAIALTGAPGSVVLYVILGIAVWPGKLGNRNQWSAGGLQVARWAFAVVWMMDGLLQFQKAFLSSKGLAGSVQPQGLAQWVGHLGPTLSITLGGIQLGIGLWLAVGRKLLVPLVGSMILSFLYWWSGQGFGQIFTPLATDFNSGLLYILLALGLLPLCDCRGQRFRKLHPMEVES
ncbi:hypothetical protein D2Q93_09625 [Alicyclobacillaceae bacterium I2511]|nr:hypothetical protein D2Q93_09625 [Alicyclobacillaceae bacterium I2511]